MNVVEVTLGDLIDRTLLRVQAVPDRGAASTLVADLPVGDSSFMLSTNDIALSVSDVVEVGSELMLVVGKSSSETPEYSVSRAYNFTTAVDYTAGTVVQFNPMYPRVRVADAIRSAFTRLEALGVPLVLAKTFYPTESWSDSYRQVIELPVETREVYAIRRDLYEVERAFFIDDLPTSDYPTGKVIRLPRGQSFDDDGVRVTFRVPYRWDSWPDAPDELSTIQIPEGAEDLPVIYSIALMMSNREVARLEVDRAEEWARTEPSRGGSTNAAVNRWWQEFYRALDEARRLDPPSPRRQYVKRMR